jgi:serine protease Do
MKKMSKPVIGLFSAFLGGVAVMAALQFSSIGRETNSVPRFNIQQTPINRETRGVTSYAPIIKRAAPSVVNIYSTRTVRERPMEMNPLFNDPMFRRFFGPDTDQPNQRGQRNGRRPRPQKAESLGSGVIVSSDGYILTANHVVEGADEIKVALATGGREFTAKVIGVDPPTDVAILKVDAKDLPAITIADSDNLEVGDVVIAIGNPFNVGQTVTMGIVSGLSRGGLGINGEQGYENFIQTDAAINPGNSGGALVDADGRLVGINTAIFSRSGGYQGVGFAVPVNLARSVMERLINFGKVSRGYLGVGIQTITPELAQEFNLPDRDGALVTSVEPNTPAGKAGLQSGDVIREVGDKKITDSTQLRLFVSQMAPGTKVTLKVLRGVEGKKPVEKNFTATLGELPVDRMANRGRLSPDENATANEDSLDGVEVSDIDAEARRQFNIGAGIRGALVTNVDEDSNAAEADLRAGDVIQEINHQPVRNADDAVELSKKAMGDRVLLRVARGRSSFYLTVNNSKTKTKE